MKKIALIGDTHFGIKNFDENILVKQLNSLFNYIFIFKTYNVDTIIQLGDLFDNGRIIDIKALYILKDFFNNLDIKFYTFAGNHDIYYKNNRQYVISEILSEILKINYIKQPSIYTFGNYTLGVSPWLINDETLITDCDILLGHSELNGYNFDYINKCKNGLDINISKYKKIYMGHYHYKQNVYVGTPYQMNFKEFGSVPGAIILDTDLNEIFIENTWDDRHFLVKIYKNNVTINYIENNEIQFNGVLPELCKIGKIIIEENNEKLDKILDFFNTKSEIKSIIDNTNNNTIDLANEKVIESANFIENFINTNKPHLKYILDEILVKRK